MQNNYRLYLLSHLAPNSVEWDDDDDDASKPGFGTGMPAFAVPTPRGGSKAEAEAGQEAKQNQGTQSQVVASLSRCQGNVDEGGSGADSPLLWTA